tara:strand:+ start:262 stop:378 length:117 start_codon:yes stop_codon:yes gene_type:complete
MKKKKSACGDNTKKSFQAGMSIGRNMKKKKTGRKKKAK